jgi:hypothetical protein
MRLARAAILYSAPGVLTSQNHSSLLMSNLDKVLSRGGRKLSAEDIERLRRALPMPVALAEILERWPLAGLRLSLAEDVDRSGYGVELQWMDVDEMLSEATETYPGLVAVGRGYVPIGICLEGSGDPYCYRSRDGAIVRVPHDAATESDLDEDQVEVVADSIEQLLADGEIAA